MSKKEWLPKGQVLLDISDVDDIISTKILEAEDKAKTSYERQKWMMFGYWKAIAIHLRKIQHTIRTELIMKAGSQQVA